MVVRIDTDGSILPPLLIFESANWKKRDFRHIIKEEHKRLPNDVLTDFRFGQDGCPYMQSCVVGSPGYFREPQSQFCAILPLDPGTYRRQLNSIGIGNAVFKRLESSLGLPELIDAAQEANDRWCQCQALYNEHSPRVILCDNLRCPMGWYHKKFVGLNEDFAADRWICNECLSKWHGNEYAKFESKEIDEKILDASDARIQRMKTLARVWKNHQWPNRTKVRRLIDQTSCRININDSTYDTVTDINSKESHES